MRKSPPKTHFKARPVTRKTFSGNPMDLVACAPLSDGNPLPLTIQPVKDLDYLAWMTSHKSFLQEKLFEHGAILFRGFPLKGVAEFESFAATQVDELFGDYGDLPPEKGNVYGVTPYPPEDTILFHNESSHMHRWPTRQLFYCEVPAATGGETPIVDCRKVLRQIDPADVKQFRELGLRYVRNFHPGVDVDWRNYFKTEDRDKVAEYCRINDIGYHWYDKESLRISQWAPAVVRHPETGEESFFNQIQLHHTAFLKPEVFKAMVGLFSLDEMPRNVTFGDGTPISDELAKRLEKLHWDNCVSFPWQAGDVLMVDNMLCSHGRLPFSSPRKAYVAMGNMFSAKNLQSPS